MTVNPQVRQAARTLSGQQLHRRITQAATPLFNVRSSSHRTGSSLSGDAGPRSHHARNRLPAQRFELRPIPGAWRPPLTAGTVRPFEQRARVDADLLSSDVAALVAGEEDGEMGDVF